MLITISRHRSPIEHENDGSNENARRNELRAICDTIVLKHRHRSDHFVAQSSPDPHHLKSRFPDSSGAADFFENSAARS